MTFVAESGLITVKKHANLTGGGMSTRQIDTGIEHAETTLRSQLLKPIINSGDQATREADEFMTGRLGNSETDAEYDAVSALESYLS